MKFAATATAVAVLAGSASAHTIFQEMWVNGKDAGYLTGIRAPSYDGPITDVTSNDLICNGGINPYQQPVSTAIVNVPAGATITTQWHHTLNQQPGDSQDPVDPSHKGPVITYLAKVSNATSMTVTGLQWFKIQQQGYNPTTQVWGVDTMIANKGQVQVQIPSCIPSGQYLMRHEMIALHGASSQGGAQFYMECAQLQITGGGSKTPSPTVSFPGAYKATDPGILIDIYYPPVTNYTIPGPALFTC